MADASLPLMGIGNSNSVWPRCRWPWRTDRAHYPSWGSETRLSPLTALVPTVVDLITPHGDRKLRGSRRSAKSASSAPHYPSWGSETPLRAPGTPRSGVSDARSQHFEAPTSRPRHCNKRCDARLVRLSHGTEGVLCSGARRFRRVTSSSHANCPSADSSDHPTAPC